MLGKTLTVRPCRVLLLLGHPKLVHATWDFMRGNGFVVLISFVV